MCKSIVLDRENSSPLGAKKMDTERKVEELKGYAGSMTEKGRTRKRGE